jgi:hypothetical protein
MRPAASDRPWCTCTQLAVAAVAAALRTTRLPAAAAEFVTDADVDAELDDLALTGTDVGIIAGVRDTGRGQGEGAGERGEAPDQQDCS